MFLQLLWPHFENIAATSDIAFYHCWNLKGSEVTLLWLLHFCQVFISAVDTNLVFFPFNVATVPRLTKVAMATMEVSEVNNIFELLSEVTSMKKYFMIRASKVSPRLSLCPRFSNRCAMMFYKTDQMPLWTFWNDVCSVFSSAFSMVAENSVAINYFTAAFTFGAMKYSFSVRGP